jgi:hypothetical protein
MRSRTEHVWPEHLKELRAENAEYKKFKQWTGELIDLSIELSKAKCRVSSLIVSLFEVCAGKA